MDILNYYSIFNDSSGISKNNWYISYDKRHALKIYSDFLPVSQDEVIKYDIDEYGNPYIDEYNSSLIVAANTESELTINSFSNFDISLKNAKIVSDEYGSEKITINNPNRIVSLIMDNSGSMSWNDQSGDRYDIAKRFIDKISHTMYDPASAIFNISSFGGKKAHFMPSAHVVDSDAYKKDEPSDLFANMSKNVYGVRLVRKIDSYPSSPYDGEIVFDGIANKVFDNNLLTETNYKYCIFTYDNNGHFSTGTFLSPSSFNLFLYPNDIPESISVFYNGIQQGKGVKIDQYIEGVWHFLEGKGNILYDFNPNQSKTQKTDLNIVNPHWINGYKLYLNEENDSELNSLRFDGLGDSYASSDISSYFYMDATSKKTFIFWVTPYEFTNEMLILARQSASSTNYKISINTNKGVNFYINSSDFVSSNDNSLNVNEPNYVAITVDMETGKVDFYINGYFCGESTISGTTDSSDMYLDISYDRLSVLNGLHGEISEISIHNTIRDVSSYIAKYSAYSDMDYIDNGDRLIVFNYYIPDNYNYTDVSVVENYLKIPSNENDGDIIYEYNVSSSGYKYFTYREDFKINDIYNFMIFTKNSNLGIYNDILNSSNLKVTITELDDVVKNSLEDINQSLYPDISLTNNIAQNNSVYISWGQITSENYPEASRIQLYSSRDTYPVVSKDSYTGTLLFNKDINETYFVDTNLINNVYYYYNLCIVDRYGRILKSKKFASKPEDVEQNLNVPLYNLSSISYRMVSNNSYEISWEHIFGNKQIKGFMNQDIVFDMVFMDDLGNILSDDGINIDGSITGSYEYYDNTELDTVTEQVVSTVSPPAFSSLYSFIIQKMADGKSKAIIQLSKDKSLFKNIKNINFNVVFRAYIKNPNNSSEYIYEYYSSQLDISLYNQLNIDIKNIDNKKISRVCKSYVNDSIVPVIKEYDGIYIGAKEPIKIRTYFDYNNTFLGILPYKYSVYSASKDLCSDTAATRVSIDNSIVVNANEVSTTEEILDENGNPTGEYKNVAYVEFSFPSPEYAKNIIFYFYTSVGIYSICKKIFISFDSTLRAELNVNIPKADAIQKTEQSVNAYIIDPDFPNDISKRILIPDGVIVNWSLDSVDNSSTRYLIGGSGLCNGICSPVSNGVARDVYIAPVANPIPIKDSENNIVIGTDGEILYEKYKLSAKLIYNNVLAEDDILFSFVPIENKTEGIPGSYFLMEFEDYKQKLYSDGISYAKLRIVHNPNITSTKNSSCFISCLSSLGKEVVSLQEGQSVYLSSSSSDLEFVYGDVTEETDPYTGQKYLNDTLSTKSLGSAYVSLGSGDSTYVYIRMNKNITDQVSQGYENISNLCSCLNGIPLEKYKYEITISGYVIAINNGSVIGLVGGGDISYGVPPTQIIPKDPLFIKAVDKEVNDISVNSIKIDGASENQIILDISFSGLPIENGTPVTLSVINTYDNVVNLKYTTVNVENKIISSISPDIRSYATITLLSLPKNKTFEAYVYANVSITSNSITRNRQFAIYINNDSEDTSTGENEGIFSDKVQYSSYAISWSDISSRMITPRGHLTLATYTDDINLNNNKIYAIGGINGNGILNTVEVFNTTSFPNGSWETKSSMNNPRMMHMSLSYNNTKIYSIGGIYFDNESNKLMVSQSVEEYDILTDTWTELSDMPSIDIGAPELIKYGIAGGTSIIVNDKIYVFSGIKGISEDGLSFDYNDRILIYDISSDTWSWSDVVSEDNILYSRLFPVLVPVSNSYYAPVNPDDILITGGSYMSSDSTKYISGTYMYNIPSGVISNGDYRITVPPNKKHKCSSVIGQSSVYMLGGQNDDYDYLKDVDVFYFTSDGIYRNYIYPQSLYASNGSASCVLPNEYIFNIGGIQSGKGQKFIKISLEAYNSMFLNGEDSVGIIVKLEEEDGSVPSQDIDVFLNGYLQFKDVSDSYISTIKDSVFKNIVKLSDKKITISNGIGYFSVSPRAEDIIQEIEPIVSFSEDVSSMKYKIVLQAIIDDENYYGTIFINTAQNVNTNVLQSSSQIVDISDNLLIDSCIDYNDFKLVSKQLKQSKPISISCYSYEPWIQFIGENTSSLLTYSQAIEELDYMQLEKPIGVSPLYDAIIQNAKDINSNDFYQIDKIVYVLSDNEPNSSVNSLRDAITENNYINEYKTVPIISGIFTVDESTNLANYNDMSSSNVLDSLCDSTGGQAITITSGAEKDDTVYSLIKAYGSIGNGEATLVIDLSEYSEIKNVICNFDLYENSDAKWNIYYSEDGNTFNKYESIFEANTTYNLEGIKARYIKFVIDLYTGLTKDNSLVNDEVPSNGYPLLDSIVISYIPFREDYLYTNEIELTDNLKQIVISIETNIDKFDDSKIYTGVSSSNTHNWNDYSSPKQKARLDGGKIIVPINGVYSQRVEPLISIDGYAFRTTYGSWDLESEISVYRILTENTSEIISSSEYELSPRDGLIIFKTKHFGSYTINISNKNKIKIGLKIDNQIKNDFINIYNISDMKTL